MATLSLAMIVKDEERTLARILAQAARFCDQLVVVDTGSTDNTVLIAQASGAEVHHFPWIDDFSAARTHSFSFCRGDFIMWLDADDVVPPHAQDTLRTLKATVLNDPNVNAVMLPYHWARNAAGEVTEAFERERIVRRSLNLPWFGRVHETIQLCPMGIISRQDAWVEHHPHPENVARKKGRNLAIYRQFIDVETINLHDLYQFACELQWNGHPKDAADTFEVLFRRAPDSPDPRGERYLARIKCGECRAITGRPDLGVMHYEAAVALDPGRAEALCLLGELHLRLGRPELAAVPLTRAVEIEVPAYTGKYIFPWFYKERPMNALRQALEQLTAKYPARRA